MKKRKSRKRGAFETRDDALPADLTYRLASAPAGTPATIDEARRSVDIVAATEQPVEVFDYDRWEIVQEVLLMDGAELPKSRQVPLLDTHQRYNTASVLGSVRGLNPESGQLMGQVVFIPRTIATKKI